MDKIIIDKLTVFAKHGVFEEEQKLGQKFLVSAELEADTYKAGMTDDLQYSISYAEVCEWITEYMKNNTFKLIESAAHKLAKGLLLKYNLLESIKIIVYKPWAPVGLPLESVSVSAYASRHTAYIAMGSNMGDKEGYIRTAVKKINDDENCIVEKVSDLIITKPIGDVPQDDFLNGCMKIRTLYTPHELLDRLHEIEADAKRERTIHWGPRTLDLDIILYDNIILDEYDLKIPHIEMHKRSFVLKPLVQIAPYAYNNAMKKTALELLEDLS